MGRGYSCKHYLDDGHRPWALKPLAGRIYRGDQCVEYHLAPASMRPIFLRVLLECMTPAMSKATLKASTIQHERAIRPDSTT